MTITSPKARAVDAPAIPVQTKLAAAWTSLMFLYIYVDYYHLYKPGVIDGLRDGLVFEFDITPMLLTGFFTLTAIPALMVTLSMVLSPRVNRIANLVVAALYVPATVFNAVGETGDWVPFYALSIGVELALLAYVMRSAWTWRRAPAAASGARATDLRHE